jgi:hypothetical protein
MAPRTSILRSAILPAEGTPIGTMNKQRTKNGTPSQYRWRQLRLSTNHPPIVGPKSARIPCGMRSRPTHWLRGTGSNISPNTEYKSGKRAPVPSRDRVSPAIKSTYVGARALQTVPARDRIMHINNMDRRPYRSENLLNNKVAKAAARPGMESEYE